MSHRPITQKKEARVQKTLRKDQRMNIAVAVNQIQNQDQLDAFLAKCPDARKRRLIYNYMRPYLRFPSVYSDSEYALR